MTTPEEIGVQRITRTVFRFKNYREVQAGRGLGYVWQMGRV